ncbi:hypothetical protein [Paenibacillus sambharensis]|nr:hypothetical protein [Paenibacillus sambharensis]
MQARIHELEAENQALRQEVLQLRKRLARTGKPGMATRLSEALRE